MLQQLKFYLQGWQDLWIRHRTVWRLAWERRHEMAPKERNADELAFMPAALALQDTPVAAAPRITAWLLMSFALLALLWAYFGQIDIVATAQGKVVPSDRIKTIQPLEAATVEAIHVSEGQAVKAGQLLLELDATDAKADALQLQLERENGRLQVARANAMLRALLNGTAPALPDMDGISPVRWRQEQALLGSEWQEYQSQLSQLAATKQLREAQLHASKAQIAKLQRSLTLTREREADISRLQAHQYVARHAWIEQKQQLIEQEGQLASELAKRDEHKAGIDESIWQQQALTAELGRTWQDRLREGQQQQHAAEQALIKARLRQQQRRLVAPVSGTVQQLAVHTVGGVVTPAQPLMVIVPEDYPLEIEAFIENKDIGFVGNGQEATVKVEAFPYTKYGTLQGEVLDVSDDAINDEKRGLIYSTRVQLVQTFIPMENKRVKLSPGMAVSVEIKTGKRRVMEYFLSPLMEYQSESFKER
ncbi:HlyD family type I secretion periplasmic adaptor subunit [Aeromonas veronii]|uniref:HlyD family type I secretion periplasmic adaptor subunit n=1 Tax=Aeromonas veronii TaxID=654 RepID=UPI003F7A6421